MKNVIEKQLKKLLTGIIEREKGTVYTAIMFQPRKPENLKYFDSRKNK